MGADASDDAFTEYVLPSLDTIDVLFKSLARWTAVEVKSAVSDGVLGDYERGIYQIVKYSAILNAMRKDARYKIPESIVVILVLESSLPHSLKTIATKLQVQILEHVKPTSDASNA